MLTLRRLVLVLFASTAAALCTDGRTRKVRFWLTEGIVNRTTNASCTDAFIANITRYLPAVDAMALMFLKLNNNGSDSLEFAPLNAENAAADWACLADIKRRWGSRITTGFSATADECWDSGCALRRAGTNPDAFAAAVASVRNAHPAVAQQFWADFEVKQLSVDDANGVNMAFAAAQRVLPTFRYAGCEPRDPPYFAENCSQFVTGAPGVVVQAANTYWATTVSSGWYGGFAKLFQQELDNIGVGNVAQLSPALCPSCPSSDEADNTLSQEQLYQRMDIMCAAGVTDLSGFTFMEIVAHTENGNLGGRYFEAMSYFRSGRKGLVRV